MDLSARYPDLKMIFIGAVNTAHKVIEYAPEQRNELPKPITADDGGRTARNYSAGRAGT
jgi:hypothetical protein